MMVWAGLLPWSRSFLLIAAKWLVWIFYPDESMLWHLALAASGVLAPTWASLPVQPTSNMYGITIFQKRSIVKTLLVSKGVSRICPVMRCLIWLRNCIVCSSPAGSICSNCFLDFRLIQWLFKSSLLGHCRCTTEPVMLVIDIAGYLKTYAGILSIAFLKLFSYDSLIYLASLVEVSRSCCIVHLHDVSCMDA